MAEIILPALPEPAPRYWCNKCGQVGDTQRHHRPYGPLCDYSGVAIPGTGYTAATVRSLLEQTARATLEQAAQKAERHGGPFNWASENADRYQIQAEWARSIAAAIRGIQVKEGE